MGVTESAGEGTTNCKAQRPASTAVVILYLGTALIGVIHILVTLTTISRVDRHVARISGRNTHTGGSVLEGYDGSPLSSTGPQQEDRVWNTTSSLI